MSRGFHYSQGDEYYMKFICQDHAWESLPLMEIKNDKIQNNSRYTVIQS